jgi:hypothetical protein
MARPGPSGPERGSCAGRRSCHGRPGPVKSGDRGGEWSTARRRMPSADRTGTRAKENAPRARSAESRGGTDRLTGQRPGSAGGTRLRAPRPNRPANGELTADKDFAAVAGAGDVTRDHASWSASPATTERHRSRTCLASGYDAVLVLKIIHVGLSLRLTPVMKVRRNASKVGLRGG